MESNTLSPCPENADAKAAFRKPLNDAASRKYRRRSPVGGSSSSDEGTCAWDIQVLDILKLVFILAVLYHQGANGNF
ncbi:hypothetical protein CsSME_00045925 [Camellia sinensis var. sinensis]